MTFQIVTANRLTDGFVVYLTDGHKWSNDIEDSVAARSPESGTQLLVTAHRAVGRQEIIDPYLIDVVMREDKISPVQYRERIRSEGPSTDVSNGSANRREAA